MTPHPYTISPNSSVAEAWRLMNEHHHTHLPVVEKGQVLGMITLKDFGIGPSLGFLSNHSPARYMSREQEQLLHKIMVREVMPEEGMGIIISSEAHIEQAAKLLLENKISGLPVVDDDDNLVGIITQTDILAAFLDLMAVNSKGARIDLRVDDDPETLVTIGRILSQHQVRIDNLVTMKANHDPPLMILQMNSTQVKPIASDLEAAGFKVESTLVKP